MTERFLISDDPALVDPETVHASLTRSYWAKGISRELVDRSLTHSVCLGVYDTQSSRSPSDHRPALVGFARIVTDHATFAYLCDVFILEEQQGHGLGKKLIAAVMAHPSVVGSGQPGDPGVRRFMLMTRDAHGLYKQYGFTGMDHPDRAMQIAKPNAYQSGG
ncbi:MAG: GNAT family N-acetyltransferase [Phycisphaerales bacterium]|nr:GNAT family N-acetyltransferase [Phycisphaerales bacterium]